MEKTRKRWTKSEERVVLSQVRRSPQNLKNAFERAARLLDRTPHAVEMHWYKVLKFQENSVAFALISSSAAVKNSKKGGSVTRIKKRSLWTRIKELFK